MTIARKGKYHHQFVKKGQVINKVKEQAVYGYFGNVSTMEVNTFADFISVMFRPSTINPTRPNHVMRAEAYKWLYLTSGDVCFTFKFEGGEQDICFYTSEEGLLNTLMSAAYILRNRPFEFTKSYEVEEWVNEEILPELLALDEYED